MAENHEIGKEDCPICLKKVEENPMTCYECLACHKKMHARCEIGLNHKRKPKYRCPSDDILTCPVCNHDSIAHCGSTDDINEEIKDAVRKNPNRIGGRKTKGRKTKGRKTKGRKTKGRKN